MKKLLNTTTAYLIASPAAGVFYREFTKFSGFAGETVLGVVHAHLLALGAGLFLLLALFSGREGGLAESKPFRRFYGLYNISLPFMACTMVVGACCRSGGRSCPGAWTPPSPALPASPISSWPCPCSCC